MKTFKFSLPQLSFRQLEAAKQARHSADEVNQLMRNTVTAGKLKRMGDDAWTAYAPERDTFTAACKTAIDTAAEALLWTVMAAEAYGVDDAEDYAKAVCADLYGSLPDAEPLVKCSHCHTAVKASEMVDERTCKICAKHIAAIRREITENDFWRSL